jgi:hypothetical protein
MPEKLVVRDDSLRKFSTSFGARNIKLSFPSNAKLISTDITVSKQEGLVRVVYVFHGAVVLTEIRKVKDYENLPYEKFSISGKRVHLFKKVAESDLVSKSLAVKPSEITCVADKELEDRKRLFLLQAYHPLSSIVSNGSRILKFAIGQNQSSYLLEYEANVKKGVIYWSYNPRENSELKVELMYRPDDVRDWKKIFR